MIKKLKPTNRFVIDNSNFVYICEAEFEENGSEWGKLTLVRTVGTFETVEEAESYADKNNIQIWGETDDWFNSAPTIVVKKNKK